MFKLSQLIQFFIPRLMFGGGGGGPTSTTTNTSNIPEYARPYVESMLGATQKQLFNTSTDENGNVSLDSAKPYQAFGQNGAGIGPGEMQAAQAAVAPQTALQNQAAQGAQNLGIAGQTIAGSQIAGAAGLGALNQQYDPMMARTQNFGMGAAQRYMNPYAMSALAPQLQEQQRQADIQGQQLAARAVGQGAFGGSRQGLEQAENARNLGMLQQKTMAEGMNTAYNNAMQQFNADQARNLQAQQANIGQQQFGANLGLQGLQLANQAAGTLGTLGQQQYAQQTGNIGLQNQIGAQQQAQNQNVLNQAIQNYANTQQYPQQQLAFMSSMIHGLPLQSTTAQSYQAAPSMTSQLAGLGTAAAGAYGLSKMAGAKKGGATKDIKKRGAGLMDLAISKMG